MALLGIQTIALSSAVTASITENMNVTTATISMEMGAQLSASLKYLALQSGCA